MVAPKGLLSQKRPNVYWAQPMSLYPVNAPDGGEMHYRVFDALKKEWFPYFHIVNPASSEVQSAFEHWLTGDENRKRNPMRFFIELCERCDEGLFTCFPNGIQAPGVPNTPNRVGAGVMLEMDTFRNRWQPVLHVALEKDRVCVKSANNWDGFTLLSIEQTVALLRVISPKLDKEFG